MTWIAGERRDHTSGTKEVQALAIESREATLTHAVVGEDLWTEVYDALFDV